MLDLTSAQNTPMPSVAPASPKSEPKSEPKPSSPVKVRKTKVVKNPKAPAKAPAKTTAKAPAKAPAKSGPSAKARGKSKETRVRVEKFMQILATAARQIIESAENSDGAV
jgi:hypothetical protein